MNFSIISLHLYEVTEASTLVNGKDEQALPAVDKCVCRCSFGI